ncbi:SAM-dependent methyltransferase [Nonomuraea polychroma]|uniref:SAM-dependent methyltransferase n=1 Tax=Nonomuraea polychroma TaxID=46176 RepID=UPI003D89CB09
MDNLDWVAGVDPNTPNVARMYDYLIRGKNHFPADIAAAEQIMKITPFYQPTAIENRYFLRRAVTHLTTLGIRQFLDIGAGLPTQGNVHEVAPHARVVYVDNDPVVIAHAHALMANTDRVRVVHADARQPHHILSHPDVHNFINWDEPVGLLMVAVLHFISDSDGAYEHVTQFRDALPAGSYLTVTHATMDGFDPAWVSGAKGVYAKSSAKATLRSYAEVERFFTGFDLEPPGKLVYIPEWHPDGIREPFPPEAIGVYGAVGKVRR